jgi:hypothetical protein
MIGCSKADFSPTQILTDIDLVPIMSKFLLIAPIERELPTIREMVLILQMAIREAVPIMSLTL